MFFLYMAATIRLLYKFIASKSCLYCRDNNNLLEKT